MSTILITGGLGYIGSHTAVVLANAGYDIVIVDDLSNTDISVLAKIEHLTDKVISFYQNDIRDKDGLEKIFIEHQIDGVIHFAAKKAVGESCEMPFDYYDNNITGSISLFTCMDKYKVQNIVFSSSATVYDPEGSPPFIETDRLTTTNPYGTTKLVMEYILKDMASYKGFNAICLRYFNPVGAHSSGLLGENPHGIPNNLLPYIFKVASGELSEVKVFGNDYATSDGTGVRDYIHVVDLAEAHLKTMELLTNGDVKESNTTGGLFDVINIGTGQGTSVLEMIHLVESITQKNISYEIVGRRSGDVAISLANPDKAHRLLGWKSSRTMEEDIRDGRNFIQALHIGKK